MIGFSLIPFDHLLLKYQLYISFVKYFLTFLPGYRSVSTISISRSSVTYFINVMKSLACCVFDVVIQKYLVKWLNNRCRKFLGALVPLHSPIVSIENISRGFLAGPSWGISSHFFWPLNLLCMHITQISFIICNVLFQIFV